MNDTALSTEVIEAGKPFALLSYASMLVGLPLFLIPMLTRDNAYALEHAKHAGAICIGAFVTFLVTFAAAFVSCGVGTPLVGLALLFYVPAVQGFLAALNGSTEVPVYVKPWSERMFSGVTLSEG